MSGTGDSGVRLRLAPEEIASTFTPLVQERLTLDDPTWVSLVTRRTEKVQRRLLRRKIGVVGRWERNYKVPPSETQGVRERAIGWLNENFRLEGGRVPCEWRSEGYLAKGVGVSRVHLLVLMRLVEALRPRVVCEVGSGSGINLFALGARFPEVQFSGLELNEDAVMRARAVQELSELPDAVRAFSPEPPRDLQAHRRIHLAHGNAKALPFPDRSFDLVFTRQALEQMQDVREQAISELRRVTRGHVAMIEAFREWNADGLRRDYIVSHGYFDAWTTDLQRHDLEPVLVFDDLPHKISQHPVLVVFRPT